MSALPIRLCCVATLILHVGCAHQLRFRVVDASSGNVLPGANVKVRRVTSFTYFQRTANEREIGSADTNGLITVPGITTRDIVSFDAPGHFEAAAALIKNGKVSIDWPISPSSGNWVYYPHKTVTNIGDIIVIQLVPLSNSP